MNKLSVMSYNIWFDSKLKCERLLSLLQVFKAKNPDIICMQEVTPDVFQILIKKLSEDEYNYKYYYPKNITTYSTVIFSKHVITKCLNYKFRSSRMDRTLVICKIVYSIQTNDTVQKKEIIIMSTHFESEFNKNIVNKIKIDQYNETQKILNQMYNDYKNVIFCADCNILSHEEEHFINTHEWTDVWEKKGSENNKYTYDCDNNIYLKNTNYKSRLDRILFRAKDIILTDFEMITTISDQYVEPSDHFGIMGKFEITNENEISINL